MTIIRMPDRILIWPYDPWTAYALPYISEGSN